MTEQQKLEKELETIRGKLVQDEKKIEQEEKRISEDEVRIAKDEAKILADEKEIKKLKLSIRGMMSLLFIILTLVGAILCYIVYSNRSVYIEKSEIGAPEIALSSKTGGILNDMSVKAGDTVTANEVVARVGDQLIRTKVSGIVTKADATVGQSFTPGQAVVTMIDPTQLRAIGHIDENKGLDRLRIGQYATFTVDAFGSKVYSGIIDEISPIARSGDVVFTISDKRQEQVFDIKVRFDTTKYPELKNGMSARIWVTI